MFTNEKRQAERTGKHGTPRQTHLQTLITEFQNPTQTPQTKLHILSNLSNFAYDPYNFPYLRTLNILELFLDCLTDPNPKVVEFAVAGVCNAAADPENCRVIVECGGVEGLIGCLGSGVEKEKTVGYAVAGLWYLCEGCGGVKEVVRVEKRVLEVVRRVAESGGGGGCWRNVARVFLDKYLV